MTQNLHVVPDATIATTTAKASAPQTPLCEPCAGIQQNWRRAPGHAELVQGNNRKVDRGQGQATITQYRCDRCGTAWEYENNKANLHAGWSVVSR
jgi:hypothetical protein